MKESKPIPELPQTWDELIECLKEGEAEFEQGEYIPWDTVTQNLKAHIREYGA